MMQFNISLTSTLVAALTFGFCAAVTAIDDRATMGDRLGRVAFYLVWSAFIAVLVPESWGVGRPLALSLTGSVGILTGMAVAKPVDRWLMRRRWLEYLNEVAQWQQEADDQSTAKPWASLSTTGSNPSTDNTGCNETHSKRPLPPLSEKRQTRTSSGQ